MSVEKGRNFSEQLPTDSMGVIINEAAAKLMGSTDPLNKNLYIPKDFQAPKSPDNVLAYHIIGVVKDFNFNSLRQQVTPLVFMLGSSPGSAAIRVHAVNMSELVAQINHVWKTMAPFQPFKCSFMDEDFNHMYDAEQRVGNIFIYFAVLAIFIACLGLYGLATYAAEQRSREIGIRKILGASAVNVASLLSRDFLGLVIISAAIAFPFAGWVMHRWLQDFAYRVGVSWWVFILAGALALIIALVTISFQAIKAGLINPVKILKST